MFTICSLYICRQTTFAVNNVIACVVTDSWRFAEAVQLAVNTKPTTSDHINIKYIWGPHVNHMGTPR